MLFRSAGDFDAAAEVAVYDYVLPVREGQFLLPDAVVRLVAEVGARGVGGCDCVRARIGEPAVLLSREAVVAAGGFARRPGKAVPWRRRRSLWEPVFYTPQSARRQRIGLQEVLRVVPAAALAAAKRKVLLVTQVGLGLCAFALWGLIALGVVQLWHVYVIAFLTGVISAFDNPARQAFVSEIVPRELLPNAVGLNSTSFNGARLIGPGVAGLLVAAVGVGPTQLINAVSFAAMIAAIGNIGSR